jgi:probable phosphoglycerate mutase
MEDPFLMNRGDATELFIVRHGDAIPDEDEIIPSGIYDDLPLSRLGREQAEDLAERLRKLQFDAIYSSPLRRCQETAASLAQRLELTPIIAPGIKEIRLGDIRPLPEHGTDLSMLTQALKERQIDIVRIAAETGSWDTIPNSEPSKEFRQRVVTAFDEIASKHAGGRIIAFAHGGVVNAYVAEVLGLARDFFFPAANTSISIVRVSGKRRVLYVLNDFAHIKRHV